MTVVRRRRHIACFDGMLTLARPWVMCGLALVMANSLPTAAFAQDAASNDSSKRVSLWDRPMPGTNATYAELTVEGKSTDVAEPILLPLPAPAVAAGVGLGIAYVVRRRFGRR